MINEDKETKVIIVNAASGTSVLNSLCSSTKYGNVMALRYDKTKAAPVGLY